MVGSTLEAGREHPTKEIIMSVNSHFVSELVKMKEGVECPQVAVKRGHQKFSQNQSVVISFNSGESGVSACWTPFFSEFVGSLGRAAFEPDPQYLRCAGTSGC